MELQLRYQLDGEDGLECMKLHSPSYGQKGITVSLACAGIVALGAIQFALPGEHQAAWTVMAFGASIFIVGAIARSLLVARLRNTWNQIEPVEMVIDSQGLKAKSANASGNERWERFVKVREGPRHFLLYRSQDLYTIIPKRGFADEGAMEAFRKMVGNARIPAG